MAYTATEYLQYAPGRPYVCNSIGNYIVASGPLLAGGGDNWVTTVFNVLTNTSKSYKIGPTTSTIYNAYNMEPHNGLMWMFTYSRILTFDPATGDVVTKNANAFTYYPARVYGISNNVWWMLCPYGAGTTNKWFKGFDATSGQEVFSVNLNVYGAIGSGAVLPNGDVVFQFGGELKRYRGTTEILTIPTNIGSTFRKGHVIGDYVHWPTNSGVELYNHVTNEVSFRSYTPATTSGSAYVGLSLSYITCVGPDGYVYSLRAGTDSSEYLFAYDPSTFAWHYDALPSPQRGYRYSITSAAGKIWSPSGAR